MAALTGPTVAGSASARISGRVAISPSRINPAAACRRTRSTESSRPRKSASNSSELGGSPSASCSIAICRFTGSGSRATARSLALGSIRDATQRDANPSTGGVSVVCASTLPAPPAMRPNNIRMSRAAIKKLSPLEDTMHSHPNVSHHRVAEAAQEPRVDNGDDQQWHTGEAEAAAQQRDHEHG